MTWTKNVDLIITLRSKGVIHLVRTQIASIMCSFLLGNKKFEQAPNLAQWNIKGWSGVGLGYVCNGSAIGKPFSL